MRVTWIAFLTVVAGLLLFSPPFERVVRCTDGIGEATSPPDKEAVLLLSLLGVLALFWMSRSSCNLRSVILIALEFEFFLTRMLLFFTQP